MTAKTLEITLKSELEQFVSLKIATGEYQSVNEVINASLLLWLNHENNYHIPNNIHKKELLDAVYESRQAFIKREVKSGNVADLMAELEEE
jgi:Arc/MetJ-type ribon-helix-helix transcriptional regulator